MSMSRQNAKRAELILVSSTIYSDDAAEVSKFTVFVIHDTLQIIELNCEFTECFARRKKKTASLIFIIKKISKYFQNILFFKHLHVGQLEECYFVEG
jgi:hypothetical protein